MPCAGTDCPSLPHKECPWSSSHDTLVQGQHQQGETDNVCSEKDPRTRDAAVKQAIAQARTDSVRNFAKDLADGKKSPVDADSVTVVSR